MKHLIAAALIALPVASFAQEEQPPSEGFSLIEEGARLLMRGMLDELEPALDEFALFAGELEPVIRNFAQTYGPRLAKLLELAGDLENYEAPEFLPNGDIIMRRREEAPVFEPQGIEL